MLYKRHLTHEACPSSDCKGMLFTGMSILARMENLLCMKHVMHTLLML